MEGSITRRGIDIFAREGSPVVAVNDGVIKRIGQNSQLGRHIVLQDVYGNRFTYAHLGSISQSYPVPKQDANAEQHAQAIPANDDRPTRPASGGPRARHLRLRRRRQAPTRTARPHRARRSL